MADCGGLTVQLMSESIWGRSRRKGKKTATQSWAAEMFWGIISLKKLGYSPCAMPGKLHGINKGITFLAVIFFMDKKVVMVTLSHRFRQLNEWQCSDSGLNVKYYLVPKPPPFSKQHLNALCSLRTKPTPYQDYFRFLLRRDNLHYGWMYTHVFLSVSIFLRRRGNLYPVNTSCCNFWLVLDYL